MSFDIVTNYVEIMAGVKTNLGKCAVWSPAGGDAPPGIDSLGKDVWKGDLPTEQNGLVILGCPVGSPSFCKAHASKRIESESEFLSYIPLVAKINIQ